MVYLVPVPFGQACKVKASSAEICWESAVFATLVLATALGDDDDADDDLLKSQSHLRHLEGFHYVLHRACYRWVSIPSFELHC
mmetsp:Transcript_22411/g.41660  ORF Transcript_22411/g.41660 Transcript_22411/m.41660 type:complete len:83 (-) Transcript_22411:806-1054(-)